MSLRISAPRALLGAAIAAAAAFGASAPAQAGRLIVTGHDADHHCARDAKYQWAGACHFAAVAASYVRAGSTKPVLLLDRGDTTSTAGPSLDTVVTYTQRAQYGSPVLPVVQVDPRSPQFKTLPLTTTAYSAIIVASSKDMASDPTKQDLNEIGSTPDSDAINARKADIAKFYDAGGGIVVFSGGAAARKNSKAYYAFLNITRGGNAVAQPFSLTPLGRTIGFRDKRVTPADTNDINCCETHVSFEQPAADAQLKVAETDTAGKAVTLTASTPKLADVEEPFVPPSVIVVPPSTKPNPGTDPTNPAPTCLKRKSLKIQLRRPKGVRFTKVVVYVNGKKKKTVRAKKLGTKRKTKAFRVRLSTKRKKNKVRIVATTASGRKVTVRRTYKRCR